MTKAMLVQVKSKNHGSNTYLISSLVFSTSDFCFSRVFSLAMVASLTLATFAASAYTMQISVSILLLLLLLCLQL